VLMSELVAGLEPLLPPVAYLAHTLLHAAPALVAGIEFAVPALLLLHPRFGVLLALVFHQTINLMPTTYAGGFSIAMCCRLLIFLPGCSTVLQQGTLPKSSAALVGLATTFMLAIHNKLDWHGGTFLLLALFYFVSISAPPPSATLDTLPPPASWAPAKAMLVVALSVYGSYLSVGCAIALLVVWAPLSPAAFFARRSWRLPALAALVGFWYGFVHPVAGVQMMASSTMYGNVQNYGTSNHLLVPTGLLQRALAEQSASDVPSLLADFAGGYVRVERTTSSALRQLAVLGAEVTPQLPKRSRTLLAEVNASGRYFEFYAARNYYGRDHDLQACALNDRVTDADETARRQRTDDPPYVVPAYELRRALALARERAEGFSLVYTPLPAQLATPSEWKAYEGPKIEFEQPADGAAAPTCERVERTALGPLGRAACDGSEIVQLPPPSWMMRKLLLPYPIPLLDGAGDGIHCTT